MTIGSNYSDAVPKAAFQAMVDYCAAQTGTTVTVNTTDHGKFQDNLTSYLQGTPDDIFTWFAGYRMRYFADQGLLTPIDDVWAKIGSNYSDAFKAASTGNDGKSYFVPIYNYPWVVMYRKSVFDGQGLHRSHDLGRVHRPRGQDEDRRPHPAGLRVTSMAGRPWARSTSSTCASTATSSMST